MKKNEDMRSKIIARAWKDPAFKKRLLQDPKGALKEMGLHVDNTKIKVIEDTNNSFTFVLPPMPSNITHYSDEELARIAAAEGLNTGVTCPRIMTC